MIKNNKKEYRRIKTTDSDCAQSYRTALFCQQLLPSNTIKLNWVKINTRGRTKVKKRFDVIRVFRLHCREWVVSDGSGYLKGWVEPVI